MSNARITISRIGSSALPEDNYIQIDIEDKVSGLLIARTKMNMEQYGMLMTASGSVPAEFTFKPTQYTIDNMGKKFEGKEVFVTGFKKMNSYDEVALDDLIKYQHCNDLFDGWTVNDYGLTSRQSDKRGHRVYLKRYVEIKDGEDP